MRRILSLALFTFLGLSLILTAPSCAEDEIPGGGPVAVSPTINLSSDAGYISSSVTVNGTDTLKFKVQVTQGDDDLNGLTVLENSAAVPGARIIYPHLNGSPANNPQLILGDDQTGLTWDVYILNPGSAGVYTYTFEVVDKGQQKDDISVDVTIASQPATINYGGGATVSVAPDQRACINMEIVPGSSKIASIAIYEDGTLVDAARGAYDDASSILTPFDANPFTVPTELEDGYNGCIYVTGSTNGGIKAIEIVVTDAAGEETKLQLDFIVGTPIDATSSVVLFFNADGQGFGGLDLATLDSVSAGSANADIIDSGIDTDKPNDENWLQTIEPANGATMRIPSNFQPESFDFDAFTLKEQVRELFTNGSSADLSISEAVEVDDIFVVKSTDGFFLLKVLEVKVTPGDNDDFYRFDVKQAFN